MGWRIVLAGVLAAAFAGCREPPLPGGAGDASVVDVALDTAESDPLAIDLLSDPNHCGALGVQCSRGLGRPFVRCEAGRCVCGGNRAACGSPFACSVDLDVDNGHCGRCEGVCSLDAVCVSGRCEPCPEGYATCGSSDGPRCTTSLNSVANCGRCGLACSPESVCVGGRCVPCPEGYATCGSPDGPRCDTRLDTVNNCGACGRVCGPTERCVGQTCQGCPVGLTACAGSTCVDLQTDRTNCGRCGQVCGVNESCMLGRCMEVPCPEAGAMHCDSTSTVCTSVLTDPQNCGACGNTCLDGRTSTAVCAAGVCTRTCRPGYSTCGVESYCDTELAFSDEHCGRCDVRCGALSHCIGGVCTSLAARPVAPLSPVILGVQRPRFRWQRAEGVDGVRLQLCADRACERVESTRDLSVDEYRPDVALTPGVHYWRLFARRGGVVSASPSPVWEFVVPSVDIGREVTDLFHDIDGDGVEDEFSDPTNLTVRHSIAPGEAQTIPLSPSYISSFSPWAVYTEWAHAEFSGDIDGDGFGDLVSARNLSARDTFEAMQTRGCALLRGGSPHFSTSFRDVGMRHDSATGYDSVVCTFAFDLDGDGHGDIVSSLQDSLRSTTKAVHFGGQSAWTTPTPNVLSRLPPGFYTSVDWGDFNGDARMELVHISRDVLGDIERIDVLGFARGASSPVFYDLPSCSPPLPFEPLRPSSVTVLDANHDGFDDLQGFPWSGGTATYFGGAAGFTRCVYDPTGH